MLMQGFREAVQTNLSWFEGTKLIVISNTLWVGEKVCQIPSTNVYTDSAAASHLMAPSCRCPA